MSSIQKKKAIRQTVGGILSLKKTLKDTAIEIEHLVTNPTVVASSSIKGLKSRLIFQITVDSCSSSYEQTDLPDKLKKKEKVEFVLNSICVAQAARKQEVKQIQCEALVNNKLETF